MFSTRTILLNAALFLGPFTVYALTLPGTITLEDAGLFQMVCQLGGIAHPPGYPTFTLICQAVSQLPFFPADATGLNLLSAFFAAAAIPLLYHCVRMLAQDDAVALIAALAYAFSNTFWSQAIIVEVYTFAAFLFLLTWLLTIRFTITAKPFWLYLAALATGVSLTNHWPLMILASPALLATAYLNPEAMTRFIRSPLNWVVCAALFIVGLTPYWQLLLTQNPVTAVYGGVSSMEQLVGYINRSAYDDQQSFAGIADRVGYAVWLGQETLTQLGYLGAPFMLYGIYCSARRLPVVTSVTLILLFAGGTFALNLLINFRFEYFWQAIYKPYPIIAYIAPTIWFAFGAVQFSRVVGSRLLQPPLSPLLQGLFIAAVLVANLGENYRANNHWVESYGRTTLETLPDGAVFFVRGDFEVGVFGYLHYVQGVRPDVELRSWNNLVYNNRLSSDVANGPDARQALAQFLQRQARPVLVSSAPLRPVVDLGATNQYVPGGANGAARNPEQGPIMDYVIELYRSGLITDPHELNVAYYLLVQFTRHHTALARVAELNDREFTRLVNLQQTFPGQLATLEAAVRHGQYPLTDPDLLATAERALNSIPEHVPLASTAVFFEYYGRILAAYPDRLSDAERAFEQSLGILPSADNKTLCAVAATFPERLDALRQTYPDATCLEQHSERGEP